MTDHNDDERAAGRRALAFELIMAWMRWEAFKAKRTTAELRGRPLADGPA